MASRPTKKSDATRRAPSPTPIRTCVGCRTRKPDNELIRVHIDGSEPVIDVRGVGRGAWICPQTDCVESAGRSKAFSRAFRSKLADGLIAGTLLGWLDERRPA